MSKTTTKETEMTTTATRYAVTYVLVVDEPTTYIDRSLPTASAWLRYTLEPGEYPLEADRDRLTARVAATLEESYYVNQLFTASSVSHETDLGRTGESVYLGAYTYEVTGRYCDGSLTRTAPRTTIAGCRIEPRWSAA